MKGGKNRLRGQQNKSCLQFFQQNGAECSITSTLPRQDLRVENLMRKITKNISVPLFHVNLNGTGEQLEKMRLTIRSLVQI